MCRRRGFVGVGIWIEKERGWLLVDGGRRRLGGGVLLRLPLRGEADALDFGGRVRVGAIEEVEKGGRGGGRRRRGFTGIFKFLFVFELDFNFGGFSSQHFVWSGMEKKRLKLIYVIFQVRSLKKLKIQIPRNNKISQLSFELDSDFGGFSSQHFLWSGVEKKGLSLFQVRSLKKIKATNSKE